MMILTSEYKKLDIYYIKINIFFVVVKWRFGKVGNFATNLGNTGFPLTIKNFKIFN